MHQISIPESFTKGEELVVIPRKDYDRFLRLASKEKKPRDVSLEKAMADVHAGRVFGPFKSAADFKKFAGKRLVGS